MVNIFTLVFSGYCLAVRLFEGGWLEANTYSSIYAGLALVDLLVCIALFKKVTYYQYIQQISPNSIQKVKLLDCLKWVSIILYVFFVFITGSYFFNK